MTDPIQNGRQISIRYIFCSYERNRFSFFIWFAFQIGTNYGRKYSQSKVETQNCFCAITLRVFNFSWFSLLRWICISTYFHIAHIFSIIINPTGNWEIFRVNFGRKLGNFPVGNRAETFLGQCSFPENQIQTSL
jgi:hypothetical protein